MRNGINRFLCKTCGGRFSVDHRVSSSPFWIPYVDGLPFRKLGQEECLSPAQTFARVLREMESLPSNTEISKQFCDPSKWSGILNLDGKYVKILSIKSPNKKSIPWLWGVDFSSHDFPLGLLVSSEDEKAFLRYFQQLKKMDYPLKVVVCDSVFPLQSALFQIFPEAKIQLCHTHYLENIRKLLNTRTDPTYRHFFHSLVKWIFRLPKTKEERELGFAHLFHKYAKGDLLLEGILLHIRNHEETLFVYQSIPDCPATNNIIESFNSHLKGRLKTMKGFQTFLSARTFLNAWLLRRRTSPFTDCDRPFKHLNGKSPLQITIKDGIPWPQIPGIQAPKTER
ncbi:MAG: hypothetical protein UU31_C0011G0016 [Candidatus Uhrbacteria bacterium GW2011_GWA2_41_10]|uniref:Mutator family transposase n=1 Tax=Candidatus Uhrbacteria bacterium GW2011_GWC2_41_11 TaxID=1618985 RepID=A0A0G0UGT2_9BACT|nr:MAG: hypothetical protein UU31_C0011G0016 [Candidatus Uhrbacteria bacterium GW2011_GWA2_41_10]KKR86671.1 MAG: hypothetical protein UU35_C0010G0049 [Candidatus Uhrbacteria bacterium GW2011_GWC2_41_11]